MVQCSQAESLRHDRGVLFALTPALSHSHPGSASRESFGGRGGTRRLSPPGWGTVPLQWLAGSTRARRVVRPNGPTVLLLQKMPSGRIVLCGRASVRIVTGLRPHGKTAEAPYSRSGIGRRFLDRRDRHTVGGVLIGRRFAAVTWEIDDAFGANRAVRESERADRAGLPTAWEDGGERRSPGQGLAGGFWTDKPRGRPALCGNHPGHRRCLRGESTCAGE